MGMMSAILGKPSPELDICPVVELEGVIGMGSMSLLRRAIHTTPDKGMLAIFPNVTFSNFWLRKTSCEPTKRVYMIVSIWDARDCWSKALALGN